ncbi:MAG: AI-2E family transporter [Candidatus Nitronauta litoralis]|uniref:AI-2E family transporter n=1 Tax=Candidatus Nitronauta litoralis TaxID=2705533 RepID=A0A7T0G0L5_9BACT|nr:MAG: AI-2E family transporter [Candidatus Nitronauta litoralis]
MKEDKRFRYFLFAALAVSLVALYLARNVLTPFAIAFALAYLLDPLADKLERWKLSRTLSVSTIIASFFLLVVIALIVLIPLLRIQVEHLAANLPDYMGKIMAWLQPILDQISLIEPAKIKTHLKEIFEKLGTVPLTALGSATEMLWSSLSGLMGIILMLVNILIIPVAMFYLLRDFDGINRKLVQLIPPKYRRETVGIVKEIDEVLSGFVRGQLMVATLMSGLYTLGLFLCDTPMSLFIGPLAGYANLVPYLGLICGFVPAAILTLLQHHDVMSLLGVVIVFGLVQMLEGMVITPRVVGDKIGLHPVVIMLAVLVGGELFGFVGVLLGVPAAAVLNVLRRRTIKEYKKSTLFR